MQKQYERLCDIYGRAATAQIAAMEIASQCQAAKGLVREHSESEEVEHLIAELENRLAKLGKRD